MSRMKRSNKNRKNNELKKILGLALAIGIIGTTTSYAYFSSKAQVSSNLKVTMGTLDVNLKDDGTENTNGLINISDLKPNSSANDAFKVENAGNLKQKFKIKMNLRNDSKELLNYMDGELVFEDLKGSIVSKPISLNQLFNGSFIEVINLEDKPLVIDKEMLIGKLKITVKNSVDYNYENKSLDFDISVRGTQVNNKDWLGFN